MGKQVRIVFSMSLAVLVFTLAPFVAGARPKDPLQQQTQHIQKLVEQKQWEHARGPAAIKI